MFESKNRSKLTPRLLPISSSLSTSQLFALSITPVKLKVDCKPRLLNVTSVLTELKSLEGNLDRKRVRSLCCVVGRSGVVHSLFVG